MLKVNKAIYYIIPYTLLLLLVLNLRDSELGAISDPYCKGIISFDDEGNEVPLADAD